MIDSTSTTNGDVREYAAYRGEQRDRQKLPPAPYPGLRAFRPEESLIFSGRAQHRIALLEVLEERRFLAVVGASGSGKSSLVLAGLLPDIEQGQLIGVEPEGVRIISLQPGLRPFTRLAEALEAATQTGITLEPVLRRGPLGLVQALDEVSFSASTLVLVVDQFEEIFRFADMTSEQLAGEDSSRSERPLLDGADNEAQAFVNLLLRSATESRRQIYVLLTMRSEFLARCDEFTGLPESISRSQFLTPRLNRPQLEQAIVRPLDYYGATIQSELVNLILNEISTEQDQLPLMQHALARMWERHRGEQHVELTVEDYNAVGGLADALDRHGDDLCELLKNDHHIHAPPTGRLAEASGDWKTRSPIDDENIGAFFRTLAHHPGANVPPMRRPARVAQIADETGLSREMVRTIADVFRAEGAHLLMPPKTKMPELGDDEFIDISHESLLRQWKKLRGWLAAEWRQRQLAEALERSREDWEKNAPEPRPDSLRWRVGRWKDAGEAVATRLYREARPVFFGAKAVANVDVWARRYAIDWPRLANFCQVAFWWKRVTAVMSKAGGGLLILTFLLIVVAVYAFKQSKLAAKSEREAIKFANATKVAKEAAEAATKAALVARETAETNSKQAVQELNTTKSDLRAQRASYEKVIRSALREPSSRTPEVMALLATPELHGLLDTNAEATPVPLSAPGDLAGPATKNLNLRAPKIAFLKKPGEMTLITGGQGAKTTAPWNFTQGGNDATTFPFESTNFFASTDGTAVVSTAGDNYVHLITASGVSSSASKEAISVAKPVDSSGRTFVIIGTENGSLGLWNGVADAPLLLYSKSLSGIVNSVDLSVQGNALVASGDNGWARLLSFKTFPTSPNWTDFIADDVVLQFKAPVRGATIDPHGRLMLLPLGTRQLEIRRLDDAKAPTAQLPHDATVTRARFSPNGNLIASADVNGRVYLWRTTDVTSRPGYADIQKVAITSSPRPMILSGHRAELTALEWSPQGDYLLTAGKDGLAIVWQDPAARFAGRVTTLPFLLPSHEGGVTSAAVSPDGDLVATAGADGVARVFPLRGIMRGKFREWAPALDHLVTSGENLAFLTEADAASLPDYFLKEQPPGTRGLVFRLNPKSRYIAARWDYSYTSRSFLKANTVLVRRLDAKGQRTGEAVETQPVDWGPPAASGFDFAISPGLVQALRLQPGESIEVEVSLLQTSQPAGY